MWIFENLPHNPGSNESYLNSLIEAIPIKIRENDNKTMLKIVGLLGSQLAHNEFSLSYLFGIGKSFLKDDGRSFEAKLAGLLRSLSTTEKAFEVVIKVEFPPGHTIPNRIRNVVITPPPQARTDGSAEASYLTGGDYTRYGIIEVTAKDSTMAGVKAVQELESALDVYSYGFPLNKITIDSQVIVYLDGGSQLKIVESRPPVRGYFLSDEEWFDVANENVSKIYANSEIQTATKDKIRSALRYSRQGRLAVNIEEKFMTSWIAFEFLLRRAGYRTMLDPIIEHAPKMLSIYWPRRILRDLIENMNRLGIQYSRDIREILDIQRPFERKEACLISIIRDATLENQLITASVNSRLLRFRLEQTAVRFSNSNDIWKYIDYHEQSVYWHLGRIYRLRNGIVHRGEHNLLIDQLSSNLISYLNDILNEVIYQ